LYSIYGHLTTTACRPQWEVW